MKTLTVKELRQEIKAIRNIMDMNTKAVYDTPVFGKVTLRQWHIMECGISTLRKAELEEIYAELLAFRAEFDGWVQEHAQAELAHEESQEVPACPAVEAMLEQAFGKQNSAKKKAKSEPKYGTVEKRKQLVADKLALATQNTKDNEWKVYIGKGNQKLQGILTWSIPPVETCPYATEACIMKCYALKDYYRNWDNVSKSQNINYEMSKREDFVEVMTKLLKIEAMKHEVENMVNGTTGKLTVRIHVAGDFYSQEYFEKWVQITDNLKGLPIQFGCYTKSIAYIKNHLKATGKKLADININFNFSVWHDTKEKFINMAEELGMNIFTAFSKKEGLPTGYIQCPNDFEKNVCGTKCNMCYEKTDERKKIAIAIH
jgi:hypothetical protein